MPQTILIVDDEPVNLATLRQILSTDHALVFARNGNEALAAVAKHQPALILMDIEMPEMDGYTACRQLKANPQTENIPIIFVTSLSDIGNETAGFEAGAVDYLVKPVSPPVVRARVRTHLSLVSTKHRYRHPHLAHGGLQQCTGFCGGLDAWRLPATRIGRPHARHRQVGDCRCHFAQTRETGPG